MISAVQCCHHILTAGDCALLTFGMVFVQLISSLLPFLNPVLERCDQTFQESAAVAQRESQGKCKCMMYKCIAVRFSMSTEVTVKKYTYLVKWRNFASMLLCLIHILVRAEPMSLVAP